MRAKQVSNQPDVLLKARRVLVNGAALGFVNEQADPHYRVFMTDTNVVVENQRLVFTESISDFATGDVSFTGSTAAGTLVGTVSGGPTIYNTPTASPLSTSSLLGTDAQRTIAAGACATLTFSFVNNVDTNPADYTGSAHFNPFGDVTFFP